uniref:UCH catalytic domain-containing protein n=1 Tax=Rhizochromulina marina TaxID=1034831 RepID=A0A7S2R989_9STRA
MLSFGHHELDRESSLFLLGPLSPVALVGLTGETEGAGTDDAQDQHFICFINFEGNLMELDGRTFDAEGVAFPFNHGATTPETFLSDAAKVIREDFMARDPENVNFNVTALCKLD